MKKQCWLAILMAITILGISGFQGYWLKNNYDREKQNLEIKTSTDFRNTILKLQASRLRFDKINLQFDSLRDWTKPNIVPRPVKIKTKMQDPVSSGRKTPPITMINLLQEKMKEAGTDSVFKKTFIIEGKDGFVQKMLIDSLPHDLMPGFNTKIESFTIHSDSFSHSEMLRKIKPDTERNADKTVTISSGQKKGRRIKQDSMTITARGGIFIESDEAEDVLTRGTQDDEHRNAVFRFLYIIDSVSLKDSVTVKEITKAYTARLKESNMADLSFSVHRLDSSHADSSDLHTVTLGFSNPVVYRLSLDNKVSYLLKKITLPILFSLFLVGITIVSFVLLYRNLARQRRLAELKNEFISNITHELKTPIATVGVAIEALKNFNAIHDPQRTKEYLDISQNELQRLSLLVDKVLKLSMFEKKEIELKKEQFDCRQLAEEVMSSMKLQFEKYHARVKLHTEGDNFIVEADKLHITSVIYNLLDNAIRYSKEEPVIDVHLRSHPDYIEFSVSDNGIGIAPVYKEKVFDKFFRVPAGNTHNVKGYGLGLSYVAEVIKRHRGNVHVESELGKGSTFTAKFPYV